MYTVPMNTQNKNIIISLLIIISALAIGYMLVNSPRASAPVETQDSSAVNGKLNIQVVCESALAYMSFPDGASAELFVSECMEGKHPEVIERYKADMNLGDGAVI